MKCKFFKCMHPENHSQESEQIHQTKKSVQFSLMPLHIPRQPLIYYLSLYTGLHFLEIHTKGAILYVFFLSELFNSAKRFCLYITNSFFLNDALHCVDKI